jgi:ArsR family transcriptional regulator
MASATIRRSKHEKAVMLFHALSDETRLEIIERLKDGEQCVCDLMHAVGAAQSRLSFHLKVLKEAGVIEDRPEGRWVYYALSHAIVTELEAFANALKRSREKRRTSHCG